MENRENGKQIEEFYDPVNHELFVYLNLEKFKEIMISNWIFDQDDFINRLNQTLFETTKEINHEISIQKENYIDDLENEVIVSLKGWKELQLHIIQIILNLKILLNNIKIKSFLILT